MKLWVVVALLALWPVSAYAQSDYGQRLQGKNGWLLPVATRILGSDEQMHRNRGSVNAWDLVAPNGSAIYAMAPGAVIYAGCNNAGGYGCWVLLQHASGFTSAYGHMISGSIRVKAGQAVNANTMLGQVGWTGKTSFGPHTHFEIRHGGAFQPIGNYFNVGSMKPCRLCSVGGSPVAAQGIVSAGANTGAGVGLVSGSALVIILVVFCLIMGLYLVAGESLRKSATTALALYSVVVTCVLFTGVGSGRAGQQSATIGGEPWKVAYAAMRRWEGNSCTHDPVRTFRGVTNTSYNAWRMQKGWGPGDVCRDMSDAQMQAIYYERYWLVSGANKLPAPVAITVFDFAVNAGPGQSSAALAVCGANAGCINNYREQFYRSSKDFYRYGAGWLNRLSSIRSITER